MIDISFDNYLVFFFVLIRISGMILFHPIFSRRNVPAMLKGGLVLALSVIISSTLFGQSVAVGSMVEFVYIALKEFAIGWIYGFIFQMFMSVILIAGEVMDMQMGLSMSKVFDPSSNIQMALTGSFMNIMFYLIFFISDSHLTMIRMMILSYDVVPVGAGVFNFEIGTYVVGLFSGILTLSLKLALPVMTIEIISEACIGVLMKAIPQINVFVVNIQIKVLVGILVLLILVGPMGSFIQLLIDQSFAQMGEAIRVLAAG
ncbi:MAG: flagellar biosynthetic protein FliR [Acetanaerobacterium sp.]